MTVIGSLHVRIMSTKAHRERRIKKIKYRIMKTLLIPLLLASCKATEQSTINKPIKFTDNAPPVDNGNRLISILTMLYVDSGTVIFVNADTTKRIFIPRQYGHMLDKIENFIKKIP